MYNILEICQFWYITFKTNCLENKLYKTELGGHRMKMEQKFWCSADVIFLCFISFESALGPIPN